MLFSTLAFNFKLHFITSLMTDKCIICQISLLTFCRLLRLSKSPELALKFNCGSFRKKFVEIEFQEVTERSSFTLIIRQNNAQKMRLFDALLR